MVTLQFVLDDLFRQRNRTLTLLACLIFSSASAIFLLLMGLSLGVNFATMPWRISIGLSYTFSLYIVIALSLSLVTGALIISNVQITFTNQRLKDIGIMKAVGLVEETGSFLFSEAAITTIIGCLIGGVLGAAVNLVSIKVLNAFGYSFTFSLPIVPLLALFVIVVSISFASTYFPMSRMLHRLNAIEAISGNTAKRVGRKSFLEKASRSPYYKIALRSLTARRGETLRIIVTCILCMMLVSTMIFGGQTIDSTVSSYVKGGIGENVYLIANPKIAENYAELLSFYPSGVLSQGSSISWLNQGYGVNNSFIHWLEAQPFIETVDTRIVTTATAYEIKYVTIVQTDEGPSYETIGDNRSANVLVVGINPENVTGNWVLNGRFLTKSDTVNAVIGDSVINILTNYNVEKIEVFGEPFPIVGACIDPLNTGYTVYIPYETASSILGVSNPNFVLIKVNANATAQEIGTISQTASLDGLEVLALNPVLNKNVNLIGSLVNSILIFPIMTLISLIICLACFLQLTTFSRIEDFRIMRALGARWRDIMKVVSLELFLIIISSVPLGILIGLIGALEILIFSPTFPQVSALLFSFSIIVGFTIILFTGTNYAIAKTIKKQVLHG